MNYRVYRKGKFVHILILGKIPEDMKRILDENGIIHNQGTPWWNGKIESDEEYEEIEKKLKNGEIKWKTKKPMSICNNCQKAVGKCSWSKNFTPVEGWDAEATVILNSYIVGGKLFKSPTDSFYVRGCPEFVKDGRK